MVHIPTTERKFYDNSTKVSSLGATSSALLSAAKDMQRTYMQQQQIKIDTNSTKARVEIDDFTNQWRLNNQANPNNQEARKEWQNGVQEILNKYGSEIDPIAGQSWNLTATKLTENYNQGLNQWALAQNAENVKLDIADNMVANLKLAKNAGMSGDIEGAKENFISSYKQLYGYAVGSLGETGARQVLQDYEENFMTSFIDGLSRENPKQALELLKQPEIQASFRTKDAYDIMESVIKKQIAQNDFNSMVAQYNNQLELSEKLEQSDSSIDALHLLEENKGLVSGKYYKTMKKSLMSSAGIDADTQAETASEIILEIAAIDKEDVKNYYKQSMDVLSHIEDAYSKGELSSTDRKRLLSSVKKGMGKNIEALKSEGGWFFMFNYNDAYEFIEENYAGSNKNEVFLEYFRQRNEQGDTIPNEDAKNMLKAIINQKNNELMGILTFNSPEEAEKAFNRGKLKKSSKFYINGKLNIVE